MSGWNTSCYLCFWFITWIYWIIFRNWIAFSETFVQRTAHQTLSSHSTDENLSFNDIFPLKLKATVEQWECSFTSRGEKWTTWSCAPDNNYASCKNRLNSMLNNLNTNCVNMLFMSTKKKKANHKITHKLVVREQQLAVAAAGCQMK